MIRRIGCRRSPDKPEDVAPPFRGKERLDSNPLELCGKSLPRADTALLDLSRCALLVPQLNVVTKL
jgi:hypothetical protein